MEEIKEKIKEDLNASHKQAQISSSDDLINVDK